MRYGVRLSNSSLCCTQCASIKPWGNKEYNFIAKRKALTHPIRGGCIPKDGVFDATVSKYYVDTFPSLAYICTKKG